MLILILKILAISISIILGLAGAWFLAMILYFGNYRKPAKPRVDEPLTKKPPLFSFTVTTDIQRHLDTLPHLLEKMKSFTRNGGDFMVSTGDITPMKGVYETLKTAFGENFKWYPCHGNHDHHEKTDIEFSHEYFDEKIAPSAFPGPKGSEKTTYSWDYMNAHFVLLNQYFDGSDEFGTDGDIVEPLYQWLKRDLEKNTKPAVFVFGHEPAFPFNRHRWASLNRHRANRNKFWALLEKHHVIAHFVGHMQTPSAYQKNKNGTWEFCPGESRGFIDSDVDGFINVNVKEDEAQIELYSNKNADGEYHVLYKISVPITNRQ